MGLKRGQFLFFNCINWRSRRLMLQRKYKNLKTCEYDIDFLFQLHKPKNDFRILRIIIKTSLND